jgi:adenylosuccinate synthase
MIDFADVVVDVRAGDCGKGKVAVELAKSGKYTHCLRFSGSNNAGHTIYINDKKIIGHAIPMGIVCGIKSIIGSGCVINVKHFLKEIEELEEAGINTKGLVFVAKNAHIITDEHIKEDGFDTAIGTTKRGNGPAYRDKYNRKGVRAESVEELKPYLIDLHDEFHGKNKVTILCEGAQGFELDIDWGDYPYVTSSHCNVGSVVLNGIPPQKIRNIYGVAKIYDTYVGSKSFEPNEDVFKAIRVAGGEYGATTGRPRQCNWLNLDGMVKAIQQNGVTELIINKCDILEQINEYHLIYKGEIYSFDSLALMKAYIKYVCLSYCKDTLKKIYFSSNPQTIEDFQHE